MKLQHFLGGTLRLTVETPFPPRLLNLCAQENILFWGITWHSDTQFSLTIPQRTEQRFLSLVERGRGKIQSHNTQGLPTFLSGFRHRIGFLLGLSCSLFAVSVLSQFIMIVEITGNQQVSTGEIRTALERAGLHVAVRGSDLSLSQLTQVALSHLEGVSWMSINVYGTRAVIQIEEATPAPEIPPIDGLYDIISEASGIIDAIQVHRGQALVEVGDTVIEGQVLISGNVELPTPIYSTEPSLWMSFVSSGVIWARTWRELTAVIPLTAEVKSIDGVAVNSYQWNVLGRSGTLLQHPILFPTQYEKTKRSFFLPWLSEFPFSLTHVEETPYTLTTASINQNASTLLLEKRLLTQLEALVGVDGSIVATDFQIKEENGLLKVTLQAECYEEIGYTVEGIPRQPWIPPDTTPIVE